ncbi:MAG: LysM peptidoglycan-binding domain-containing protein [Burkholderiaceae bacterium]
MKHLIPVAILLALAACGEKEQTVVFPEPSGGTQQSASSTAKESSSPDSAQTSQSSGSSSSSGSSGSSGSSDASGNEAMYTVKEGDTLAGIANRNNVGYQDLARWNNINNRDLIYPSQQLSLSKH